MIKVLVFFDLNKTSGYGHLYRFQKFKKIFPKDSNFYTVNSKFDSFIQRNKEFFDYGFIDSYNINYSVEKKIFSIYYSLSRKYSWTHLQTRDWS